MNLTAEQFAEIVRGTQSLRNGSGASRDLRRAPRVDYRTTATIKLTHSAPADANGVPSFAFNAPQGTTTATVTVRNISSRGIGLLSQTELPQGSQFAVTLALADRGPIDFLCTVAHCRRVHATLFNIGAEFTCVLSGENAPQRNIAAGDTEAAEIERIRKSMMV